MLITGGAGFIGVNLVHAALSAGHHVVCLDALTYAGNRRSLKGLTQSSAFRFIVGSIGDTRLVSRVLAETEPEIIFNLAAETHVDRSIEAPAAFVETNVVGTQRLLECACRYRDRLSADARDAFCYFQISTDEVFGSCEHGSFSEVSPMQPNSPYSASKAGGDHLVSAYRATYGLPAVITHCTNNYGPFQFPEKLIPVVIGKALGGEKIPIYGAGENLRDWIYVSDHCDALLTLAGSAQLSPRYLIGSGRETRNIDLVKQVCATLDRLHPRRDGRPYAKQIEFVTDRPGHDFRYAVDPGLITREIGWRPATALEIGIEDTVSWYLANQTWMDDIRGRQEIGMRVGLKLHA